MRTIELQLHQEAKEIGLSRKIINLSLDNNAQVYRAFCEIQYVGDTTTTYMYLPAKNLNEEDACRIIMSCLTAYYNGENFDKTRQALIDETLNKSEESNTQVSEEQTQAIEEPTKPKRTTRKKATKKKAAEEPKPVEEKPEEAREDKVEEKPAKKAKEKFIAYDRNQVEHKKEMAKVLNTHFPEWKENKDLTVKAKEVSENLVGVSLFNSKGEVIPTFEQEVIRMMSGLE